MAATLDSPLSLDAKLRDALPLVWFVSLWSNDLYFMLQYTVTKGQTLELKLALYLSVATEEGPYSTTTNPPLERSPAPCSGHRGGPYLLQQQKVSKAIANNSGTTPGSRDLACNNHLQRQVNQTDDILSLD